jgi:hypothetical protein
MLKGDEERSCDGLPEGENGGEGGILFQEVLKIPVMMGKANPNRVKRYLA